MTATRAKPAPKPDTLRRTVADPQLALRAAQTELPAGICGQVEGIALVYDVRDTYGTVFVRGCLDRTRRERLAAGKVKLFWDHGDALMQDGMYDTDLHVGTVRSLEDRQLPDGRWVAWMRADLFDTEKGRAAKEYVRAVLATGGETGLSVGVRPTKPTEIRAGVEHFVECYLGEISITAMSSVPGTQVTAVRSEQPGEGPESEAAMETAAEPTADTSTDTPADAPTDEAPTEETGPVADSATADLPADLNYEPILRGISAALGVDRFRAITRGILGDALPSDSNAAHGADSDAAARDSQPAPSEGARTDLVPQAERLAFARNALVRLYQ